MMNFLNDLCQLSDLKIILASQSPRRIEMLGDIGLRFDTMTPEVNENLRDYNDEVDFVRRNAHNKANWVWERRDTDLVIAADTIVFHNGQILGKPTHKDHARQMLQSLSGETHRVVSAFCLRSAAATIIDHESTRVHFHSLNAEEIEAYLQTGESMDKAGAYAIQGFAGIFVKNIEGCYYNVIGFPLAKFYHQLKLMSLP